MVLEPEGLFKDIVVVVCCVLSKWGELFWVRLIAGCYVVFVGYVWQWVVWCMCLSVLLLFLFGVFSVALFLGVGFGGVATYVWRLY